MRCSHLVRLLVALLLSVSILPSCANLRPVKITTKQDISPYTHIYIPSKQATNSISDVSQEFIAGVLAKRGYIILDQLDERLLGQTLILTYVESGMREEVVFRNPITEVTFQFISAATGELLCIITAEGFKGTKEENIRHAMNRGLDALFKGNQTKK